MYSIFLLIIGFIVLTKGADWLVNGACDLARGFHVSKLVIGLTVVAFGTSMPELFVNIFASFQGNEQIAIGNVIGSNIFNTLVVLGLSSCIFPPSVTKDTITREIPFSLLAVVVLAVIANDALLDGAVTSVLTRVDGAILLSFFSIFTYYIVSVAQNPIDPVVSEEKGVGLYQSLFGVGIGIGGLSLGGNLVQNSAVRIASQLGVSDTLIGLTIVAIGTSLPELATSLVAAYKKDPDIAVGNIIGSNIFNIFFILGISALIRPLPVQGEINADILVLIASTLLLFFFMFTGRRKVLDRWEGVLLVVSYVVYLVFLLMRA